MHSPLLPTEYQGATKDGLFHIVDWTPTLASLGGASQSSLDTMNLDGINQKKFLMEQDSTSSRNEFVYNIKTAPFKVRILNFMN